MDRCKLKDLTIVDVHNLFQALRSSPALVVSLSRPVLVLPRWFSTPTMETEERKVRRFGGFKGDFPRVSAGCYNDIPERFIFLTRYPSACSKMTMTSYDVTTRIIPHLGFHFWRKIKLFDRQWTKCNKLVFSMLLNKTEKNPEEWYQKKLQS